MLQNLQRELTPTVTAAYMAAGAAVVFVLAKALTGDRGFAVNAVSIRSIIGLGVIATTASFILFLRGLNTLGPVRTGIVSTIEPFCTALLGAWFLGQPLSSVTLVGGAFIAAAVILLQVRPENSAGRVS